MDVAALIRMKPMLDAVMAKNCAGCFWVYGPRLRDTMKVIEGWAFTYKSELLAWLKPGIGTGKTTRKVVENMWLATRGKGLPIRDHGVSQGLYTEEERASENSSGVKSAKPSPADLPLTIEAPRRRHSEKPDEAYKAVERLYGDVRRLDLFARRERPGWTAWGNQVETGPTENAAIAAFSADGARA